MADVALGSDAANITAINVVDQGSDPTAPGSGHVLLYVKGGVLYARGNVGSPAAVGASPALTQNRIGVGDGSNLLSALAAGTAGQLLQSNGASAPTWEDAPTGNGGGGASSIYLAPWAYESYVGNPFAWNANGSQYAGGWWQATSPAQNDAWTWPVELSAGTYTLCTLAIHSTVAGIGSFTLGGSSIGTIDWYAGVFAANIVSTITSISVATAGLMDLVLTMATKHASSGGYAVGLSAISLYRTA